MTHLDFYRPNLVAITATKQLWKAGPTAQGLHSLLFFIHMSCTTHGHLKVMVLTQHRVAVAGILLAVFAVMFTFGPYTAYVNTNCDHIADTTVAHLHRSQAPTSEAPTVDPDGPRHVSMPLNASGLTTRLQIPR